MHKNQRPIHPNNKQPQSLSRISSPPRTNTWTIEKKFKVIRSSLRTLFFFNPRSKITNIQSRKKEEEGERSPLSVWVNRKIEIRIEKSEKRRPSRSFEEFILRIRTHIKNTCKTQGTRMFSNNLQHKQLYRWLCNKTTKSTQENILDDPTPYITIVSANGNSFTYNDNVETTNENDQNSVSPTWNKIRKSSWKIKIQIKQVEKIQMGEHSNRCGKYLNSLKNGFAIFVPQKCINYITMEHEHFSIFLFPNLFQLLHVCIQIIACNNSTNNKLNFY